MHRFFHRGSGSHCLVAGGFSYCHDPPALLVGSFLCLPLLFSLSLEELVRLSDWVRTFGDRI